MASNSLVCVIILGLVLTAVSCTKNKDGPTEFEIESACSSAGGSCILKEECPVEIPTEYLGLCPKQRSLGAECCHGISTKEYRCEKYGGECFPNTAECPENLRVPKATDCASDQFCCVLI